MVEEWRPVVGHEDRYEVSNLGRVRSLCLEKTVIRNGNEIAYRRKGRILKPLVRLHGYLGVQLFGDKQSKHSRGMRTYSIHRLVAEAFIENPLGLSEVNHKDEDKTNNCASNLEWMSHKENTDYGTGIQRRAAKLVNGKRSRPVSQYTLSGTHIRTFPSLAQVKRELGFSQGNISNCANHNTRYNHAYGYRWEWA